MRGIQIMANNIITKEDIKDIIYVEIDNVKVYVR